MIVKKKFKKFIPISALAQTRINNEKNKMRTSLEEQVDKSELNLEGRNKSLLTISPDENNVKQIHVV